MFGGYSNVAGFSGMVGLLAGFAFLFFAVILAMYVWSALALMAIANKTKTKNAWLAWIPLGNIFLVTQIDKLPGWYTWGVLVSFIPFLGWPLAIAFYGFLFWKLAERMKYPGWWGILCLIPFVNLIVFSIWAWGKK